MCGGHETIKEALGAQVPVPSSLVASCPGIPPDGFVATMHDPLMVSCPHNIHLIRVLTTAIIFLTLSLTMKMLPKCDHNPHLHPRWMQVALFVIYPYFFLIPLFIYLSRWMQVEPPEDTMEHTRWKATLPSTRHMFAIHLTPI